MGLCWRLLGGMRTLRPIRLSLLLLGITSVVVSVGCDPRIERFEPNRVFALSLSRSRSVEVESALADASAIVDHLFGSPDHPAWPEEWLPDGDLVDPDQLIRAAGPVSSDREGKHLGLFREHCVVCHGLDGGGTGPASVFQNPYPRDFRHGVFKWKSTERSAKPTRDGLRGLLRSGVPGTAMPTFALLEQDDLEALVDYVIYLSVRGEFERRLTAAAVDLLDYDGSPMPPDSRLSVTADTEGRDVVLATLESVVQRWEQAEQKKAVVPEAVAIASQSREAVDRGREIFHGPIANCTGCHGPEGNGQVPTLDFDDWTKEYTTRIGVTPDDRDAVRPFREAGALRPRPVQPRNLGDGVFRGGGDSQTLYRRITQGIAGTPMPAVEVGLEPSGKSLTPDQVADLISYVQSLGPSPRPDAETE